MPLVRVQSPVQARKLETRYRCLPRARAWLRRAWNHSYSCKTARDEMACTCQVCRLPIAAILACRCEMCTAIADALREKALAHRAEDVLCMIARSGAGTVQ